MCTSKEGLLLLKQYFLAVDSDIFEPYFIAQYLLVPVNTIVKQTLHPWMMQTYANVPKTSDTYCSRNAKSEVFLKYTLLLDLMKIVQTYKRYPNYDLDNDEKLKKIIEGKYGSKTKTDKNHVICACDSFMTIWLLTLPEKFRE